MKEIVHIFRAYGLAPLQGRPRGTLTICRGTLDERWFVYFQTNALMTGDYLHMSMMDVEGRRAQLGEEERDLGNVKLIAFMNELEAGAEVHGFEVYSRLPVPPPGAKVVTAHATAHAIPQARVGVSMGGKVRP